MSPGKPTSVEFVRVLKKILKRPPTAGAEIGVFKGDLSECLLRAFKALTLHCVDPWEPLPTYKDGSYISKANPEQFEAWFQTYLRKTEPFSDRAKTWRTTSVEASKYVPDNLDFAFIDESHDYESEYSSILAWYRKVRDGGLLSGHDYDKGWPGVKRAVDQLVPDITKVHGTSLWWCRMNSRNRRIINERSR